MISCVSHVYILQYWGGFYFFLAGMGSWGLECSVRWQKQSHWAEGICTIRKFTDFLGLCNQWLQKLLEIGLFWDLGVQHILHSCGAATIGPPLGTNSLSGSWLKRRRQTQDGVMYSECSVTLLQETGDGGGCRIPPCTHTSETNPSYSFPTWGYCAVRSVA